MTGVVGAGCAPCAAPAPASPDTGTASLRQPLFPVSPQDPQAQLVPGPQQITVLHFVGSSQGPWAGKGEGFPPFPTIPRTPHPTPGQQLCSSTVTSVCMAGVSDLLREEPSHCPLSSAGSMDPEGMAIPQHMPLSLLSLMPQGEPGTHMGTGPFCSCPAAPSPLQGLELIPQASVLWAPLAGTRQGPRDERGQCLSQSDHASNKWDATQEWGGVTPQAQEGARRPRNIPAPLFRVGKQPQGTFRSYIAARA